MKLNRTFPAFLFASFICLLLTVSAHAQATTTWVSGVGDDVNPCSRTAPCKTFAGAISKTATGGEINALDPGGFGTVTITKSITIDGEGTLARILAAGTNGININVPAGSVVVLRNLSINGVSSSTLPGNIGINVFSGGGTVMIENCHINGFIVRGINFAPTIDGAQLIVRNTTIRNTVGTVPGNGGAILVKPASGITTTATIEKTQMERGLFSVRVEDNARVTVRDSVATHNTNNGFLVVSTASAAELNIENSLATHNGTNGVIATGALAVARITNMTITHNTTGINTSGGGQVVSFGNNRVVANGTDGNPTSTITTR